ncbi:MAG: RsmG family class I SAM-dependent methyltransferase [Elusimicrobiota bacterium]
MSEEPLAVLASAAEEWGAPLDAAALARLQSYLREVQAKNAVTNLTADASWENLVLKHAADGVFAAALLRRELTARGAPPRPRILDLGAGGGFIGFALKIAWPEAEVTLMEAVERKFRFLNAAAAGLGLNRLRPVLRRAGEGPPRSAYETGFDAVVERALAPLPEALSLATPLLSPRGLFAAFQNAEPDPAAPALAKALSRTGARVLKSFPYRRPREERPRFVVVFTREEE